MKRDESPYSVFSDNPIVLSDINGDDAEKVLPIFPIFPIIAAIVAVVSSCSPKQKEQAKINKPVLKQPTSKIIINLNDNPNYKYFDYSSGGDAIIKAGYPFTPTQGANAKPQEYSWVECYGVARWEIEENGFTAGKFGGYFDRAFAKMNPNKQQEVLGEINVSLSNNKPVLVAVNEFVNGVEQKTIGNGDSGADHYVIIVGKGIDEKNNEFYIFNENAQGEKEAGRAVGTKTKINRLYINKDKDGKVTLHAPQTTWGTAGVGGGAETHREYNVTNVILSTEKQKK